MSEGTNGKASRGRLALAALAAGLVWAAGTWVNVRPWRAIVATRQAEEALKQGDFPRALSSLRRAVELNPGDGRVLFRLAALTYTRLLEPDRRRFVANSDLRETAIFFGTEPATLPRFESPWARPIIAWLGQAEAGNPTAELYEMRGVCRAMLGEPGALNDLRIALQYAPGSERLGRELASVLFHQGLRQYLAGGIDSAEATWSAALEEQPSAALLMALGCLTLKDREDAVGALPLLRRSVRLQPMSIPARYGLALALARTSQPEEAARHLWRLMARIAPVARDEPRAVEVCCRLAEELRRNGGVSVLRTVARCATLRGGRTLGDMPPEAERDPAILMERAVQAFFLDDVSLSRQLVKSLLERTPGHPGALRLAVELARRDHTEDFAPMVGRLASFQPQFTLDVILVVPDLKE